ncbi:DEAD/DEAH box helicase family protein [Paenalkalicoccus suaedae]|uniref:DEAD/DEAH box helicase family protein n=2 Tax=Paenalkalicoccus suaedae TaxID=2592382 RepID=A0A859FKK5_9BACI|nr:DEAD/DEAH box helicase family protein [Paenalkalicoccus suaedae]
MHMRRLLVDELRALFSDPEIAFMIQEKWIVPTASFHEGRCTRCNSTRTQQTPRCGRCHSPCLYCRDCLQMGRNVACTPLYHSTYVHPGCDATLQFHGEFSPAQNEAAQKLVSFYEEGVTESLLHAVCGAGKTEMLFPVIERALRDGPVLVATPRRDVVTELAPRLQDAFPSVTVRAFHGGLDEDARYAPCDIAVATTHQALRFFNAFALVIIDEVDAFPFTVDRKLTYAVQKARRADGRTALVTATPSSGQRRTKHKATVPRRYHGHDLPVPAFYWSGNWQKRLPIRLLLAIREKAAKHEPTFVFVPHIDDLYLVEAKLRAFDATLRVGTVHSAEPDRADRVAAFRAGDLDVLVTTTILERGVTVPRAHAYVLGADSGLFTSSALIQIAGRVGRHVDFPTGDVHFYHHGKTAAMVEAQKDIKALNAGGGL